jgi:hypothetical protein
MERVLGAEYGFRLKCAYELAPALMRQAEERVLGEKRIDTLQCYYTHATVLTAQGNTKRPRGSTGERTRQ